MENIKISFIFMMLGLVGCGDVKTNLGIYKTPPDSFTVCPRMKALEVPPHLLPSQNVNSKNKLTPLTEVEKEVLNRIQLSP